MTDYDRILNSDERAVYDLRDLYGRYGYVRFKTGKFEEYELYARNRDFLSTDGILTFTDAKGRLIALKPDVTLSIAKNSSWSPGVVQKFCYDDYVYRLSRSSGSFREILQTGIECIGDIGSYDVCEVILLAVRSLEMISGEYILNISHMGIVRGLTGLLQLPEEEEQQVLRCIGDKNVHGVTEICRRNEVSEDMISRVRALIQTSGPIEKVLRRIDRIIVGNTMQRAVDELRVIGDVLASAGLDGRVRFDFSVVNDMGYYNGVTFQGFISGLATNVLSGGRYDNLMIKMGKKCGAIGFAVNLDLVSELGRQERELDVDIVMLDRPGEDLAKLNEAVRYFTENGMSVSVQKAVPKNLTYGKLVELFDGEVRVIDEPKGGEA
ncbi:MAG: ATP phosphoribosyltransferase regulatory subunit [Mogibacterium sp.]|nr:ATP phosphoribosyltransferase regulatory subunit [Mogibacterium sp.]